MRKAHLGGVLLAVLVVTAGCSGLLGDGPIEHSASEVSVADATAEETGFEQVQKQPFGINRTMELNNQSREVRITSHLAAYEKEYEGAPLGYFVALSTPKAEEFGQSLNPLGSIDKQTLIERAISRVQQQNEVELTGTTEEVNTTTRTILGTETEVTTFDATAERSGESADVFVQATRLEHGDDFIIAVGVYPQAASGGGSEIAAMMSGIEHETSEG